jgi:hypothetical protein
MAKVFASTRKRRDKSLVSKAQARRKIGLLATTESSIHERKKIRPWETCIARSYSVEKKRKHTRTELQQFWALISNVFQLFLKHVFSNLQRAQRVQKF